MRISLAISALLIAAASLASAQPLEQHATFAAYTADGDAGDWTGTPPATENTAVYDSAADEWIWRDAANDDTGDGGDAAGASDEPGAYTYPTNAVFTGSDADLTEVRIAWDAAHLHILVRRGSFSQDWEPLTGVLIDTGAGGQTDMGSYSDCNVSPEHAWEYWISAPGTGDGGKARIYRSDWTFVAAGSVASSAANGLQEISVPLATIGGPPANQTYTLVLYAGLEDFGNCREVYGTAEEWHGGGGLQSSDSDPDIYDLIGATQASQEADLSGYTDTTWSTVDASTVTVTFGPLLLTGAEGWEIYR